MFKSPMDKVREQWALEEYSRLSATTQEFVRKLYEVRGEDHELRRVFQEHLPKYIVYWERVAIRDIVYWLPNRWKP